MKTPANLQQSASRGLPGAVLHDISTGAWIIDVSDAGPNLDRSLIQPARDVVLVCFGTHAIGACSLDAPPQNEHGVLFETNGHPAGDSYINRLSELTRADLPIRVKSGSPSRVRAVLWTDRNLCARCRFRFGRGSNSQIRLPQPRSPRPCNHITGRGFPLQPFCNPTRWDRLVQDGTGTTGMPRFALYLLTSWYWLVPAGMDGSRLRA